MSASAPGGRACVRRRACRGSEVSTANSVSGENDAATAAATNAMAAANGGMSSGSSGSAVSTESGESSSGAVKAAILLIAMVTTLMSRGFVEISQVKSQVKLSQVKRGRGGWGTGLG